MNEQQSLQIRTATTTSIIGQPTNTTVTCQTQTTPRYIVALVAATVETSSTSE